MQAEGRARVDGTGKATIGRPALAGIVAAVVAADQLTKLAITATLAQGASVEVLGDVLRISHVRNTGAAFGILRGLGGVLALVALVGVAVFVAILLRRPPAAAAIGAALICGGALGNLTDRLVRGSVVDFVDLRFWPAFNVADTAVTIGAIVVVWFGLERPRARDTAGGDVRPDRGD